MKKELDSSWLTVLEDEFRQDYFMDLEKFVDESREATDVFPAEENVFRAFQLTGYEETRVVILGQDPYHDTGQAHGLAFSVQDETKLPPSLKNIFKELNSDLGVTSPTLGDLSSWARQGVLLLNTVLTVAAHQANSHQKRGWEKFTDRVIQCLGARSQHTVFVLWGKPAQSKQTLVDSAVHTVLTAPHPSPLSAHRGFFGSRPFSKTNEALVRNGQPEVQWEI